MTAKDKLEDNVEKAMSQIEITKQLFNEKLFGLGKIEAFIGVPAEFTKNPTSTQKIEKDILKKRKNSSAIISLKIKSLIFGVIVSWCVLQHKVAIFFDQFFAYNYCRKFINSTQRIRWTGKYEIKLILTGGQVRKHIEA